MPVDLDKHDHGSSSENDKQSVNDEENTTQAVPALKAVGNISDDEQGPEPTRGETLEDETQRTARRDGCRVILERYS